MIYKPTRRQFVTIAGATAATLAMPAVVGRAQSSGVLNMLGNESFVPSEIRDAFTAETGIQINFRNTTDASQIFNLLAAEGDNRQTDLSILAGHRMFSYIAADYLEEIDESWLPGLANINPVYRDADAQYVGGVRYGVPVLTGFATIASREGEVSPEDAETWETIFGDGYAGRVTNRAGSALYAAMFHLGLQDAWLDYDGDPGPVEEMFREAREYVIDRRHVLRTWYESAAELQQLFVGNEIDAGVGLTEAVMPIISANIGVVAGVPREGTWGWTHNYGLFKGSQNLDGAYQFVDYLLNYPGAGAILTGSTGSVSTFLDATTGLSEDEIRAISYTDEQLSRVMWLDVKGADDNRYDLLDEYGAGLREA